MKVKIVVLMYSVLSLIACGGDSDDDDGGITDEVGELTGIADIFTDEQFAVFESLGLELNQGNSPPDIEGTFRIDPRTVQASTAPDNANLVGNNTSSQNITFLNQNTASQTLDVVVSQDGTDPASLGEIVTTDSSLSGTGNAFTAFFIMSVTFDGVTFETAQGYSGIIMEDGIENFQQVSIVLNDSGDPGDFLISNNTGDLFIDLDGFSERL